MTARLKTSGVHISRKRSGRTISSTIRAPFRAIASHDVSHHVREFESEAVIGHIITEFDAVIGRFTTVNSKSKP